MNLPLVRYQIRGLSDERYIEISRKEHATIAGDILNNRDKQAERHMQRHLGRAAERLLALHDAQATPAGPA